MRHLRIVLCLTLAAVVYLLFSPRPAAADTIYSDLASSDPTHLGYGTTIGSTGNRMVGYQFTAGGTGTFDLSEIGVAIVRNSSSFTSTGDFVLTLYNDSSNALGSEITSWSLPISDISYYVDFNGYTDVPTSVLDTITVTGPVQVTGGSKYWLVASSTDNSQSGYLEWEYNNQSVTGGNCSAENGGSFSCITGATLGAFDVLGAAPVTDAQEPSSLALLGIGLLGLGLLTRRRRTRA